MSARSKLLAMAATIACLVALAGCAAAQPPSSSTTSTTSTTSTSSSSSATPVPSQGGNATIDLDYSAGTGYEWSFEADPEGVVELVSQDTEGLASGNVAGGPLQDHFTFRAIAPGEVSIAFSLVRAWEEGAEPAETQVYAFTVTDDLRMILNPYKSDFENEPTIGD